MKGERHSWFTWRIGLEILLLIVAVLLLLLSCMRKTNAMGPEQRDGKWPINLADNFNETDETPATISSALDKLRIQQAGNLDEAAQSVLAWIDNGGLEEARERELAAQVDRLDMKYPGVLGQLNEDFSEEDYINYSEARYRQTQVLENVVERLTELIDKHAGDYEAIYRDLESTVRSERELEIRPAEVTIGTPIDWEVLREFQPIEDRAELTAGNFLGNEDDELFVNIWNHEQIVSLDGNSLALDWIEEQGQLPAHGERCWDYDGDAYLELVCTTDGIARQDPATQHPGMAVFELDGSSTALIPDSQISLFLTQGDFDGNGTVDLFVHGSEFRDQSGLGFPAISLILGRQGAVLAEPELKRNSWMTVAGNPGSGPADGIVQMESHENDVPAYWISGMDGNTEQLAVPGELDPWLPEDRMAWFADFDRDGRDEMYLDGAIRDFDSDTAIVLDKPMGCQYFTISTFINQDIQPWRQDAVPLIAACIAERSTDSDTLAIWDMQGQLIYCEHMGEQLHAIGVVHEQGRERLAVLTQSRLLISP